MTTEGAPSLRGLWLTLAVLSAACGRTKTPYDHAMDRAESALERRDFEATLREWHRAAELSESPDDRQEAAYRRAHLLLRLGRTREGVAELESAARALPRGARTPRIFLDLGRVHEDAGDLAAARRAYETLVLNHQESGSSKAALERLLALEPAGEIAALTRWRAQLSSPPLLSYLRFRHARALLTSDPDAALRELEALASAEPLPGGLYTDEALLAAARMRAEQGEFPRALAHLEMLEGAIESSWFVGSYRRPSYAEALLLSGRLTRDEVKDGKRARTTFEKLEREFATSRLADDAAYEVVLTVKVLEGDAAACRAFDDFAHAHPESRFVRCRARICDAGASEPFCSPTWK